MKRIAITLVIIALALGIGAFAFARAARGFSAREEPTIIEKLFARTFRSLAVPSNVKSMPNPSADTAEVLAEARTHWADHCATCHANDGSGDTEMGRNMYPRAPDMRKAETQNLTDGELCFIIENGIRLTGMPGWGGRGGSERSMEASWKLVRFVRHLPEVSADEVREMQRMNPKTPEELQEEKEEEEFLKGDDSHAQTQAHHHH